MVGYILFMVGVSFFLITFLLHYKKRRSLTFIVYLCILSLCLTACLQSSIWPRFDASPITIKIQPLGEQNKDASSSGILIKRFEIDGVSYSPEQFIDHKYWKLESRGMLWVKRDAAEQLSLNSVQFELPQGEKKSIVFYTDPYCGLVEITARGETYLVDTYSEASNREISFSANLKLMNNKQFVAGLLGIFFLIACVLLLMDFLVYIKINQYRLFVQAFENELSQLRKDSFCSGVIFCTVGILFLVAIAAAGFVGALLVALIVLPLAIWCSMINRSKGFQKLDDFFARPMPYILALTFIIILLPPLDPLIRYWKAEESISNFSEDVAQSIELHAEVDLVQNINLTNEYKSIKLNLDDMDRHNTGSIQVVLVQGEREFSSYYNMADMVGIKALELDTSQLKEGPLILKVMGVDGQKGSSVAVKLSEKLYFGAFAENGVRSNYNLMLNIECQTVPAFSVMRLVLWFVLLILTGVAIYFLAIYQKTSWQLFVVAFLVILVTCSLRYPTLSFFSEPYYETGSNFFAQTYHLGLRKSIFIEDYKYWPLAQRLISILLVKVFGMTRWAIFAMNMIGLAAISALCAMFCLPVYENYMRKEFRFLCCLLLGLTEMVMKFNNIFFHNFTYYGVLLVLLIYMMDFEKMSKKTFLLVLMSCIFCVSKAQYVILVPVSLLCLLYCIIKRTGLRRFLYSGGVLGAGLLQFLYSMRVNDELVPSSLKSSNLFMSIPTMLRDTWYSFSLALANALFSVKMSVEGMSGYTLQISVAFITASIIIFMAVLIRKRKFVPGGYVVFACLLIAYGTYLFLALTSPNEIHSDYLWMDAAYLEVLHRRQIFAYISFMVLFVLLLSVLSRAKNGAALFLVAFCFLTFPRLPAPSVDENFYGGSRSDWSNYYVLFDKESYGFPTVGASFITRNSQILFIGNTKVDPAVGGYATVPIKVNEEDDLEEILHVLNLEDLQQMQDATILALYTGKIAPCQSSEIDAIFKDKNGDVISTVRSVSTRQRKYIGFLLDDPISGVAEVSFVGADGAPIDLRTDFYFAVEQYENDA